MASPPDQLLSLQFVLVHNEVEFWLTLTISPRYPSHFSLGTSIASETETRCSGHLPDRLAVRSPSALNRSLTELISSLRACACSVASAYYRFVFLNTEDFTWSSMPVYALGQVEPPPPGSTFRLTI